MLSEKVSSAPSFRDLSDSEIESIARKLDGQKQSNGSWKCRCPLHDDRSHSLSLGRGDDVPLVVNCFAGCDNRAVFDHLVKSNPNLQRQEKVADNVKPFAKGKKKETNVYKYYDTLGAYMFEKVRYEFLQKNKETGEDELAKEFAYRYPNNGQFTYGKPQEWKGRIALYNWPKLARLKNVPVIICEGEKDCDTLNTMLGDDFVAVTNDNGGSNWNAHAAENLKGREIIIAEDCDRTGRERTRKIQNTGGYKKLLGVLRFLETEVGEHGDVTDWITKGATASQLRDRLKDGLEEADDVTVKEGKRKAEEATQEDYFQLFQSVLGETERDIFSDSLLYRDGAHWRPAKNKIGLIRATARELTRTGPKEFSPAECADQMDAFEFKHKPRLIPDIPAWPDDNEDRLQQLANVLILDEDSGLTNEYVGELLKEWTANIFRKVSDPSMNSSPSREFIWILQGPQKIGKDYWLRTLLCGLGQWFSDMTISQNERDNFMQMHRNMVLNISEFDRTSRMESGMIKDMITKSATNIRAAYAAEEEYRLCRCSFTASINTSDILRDHTGNSRYCIIPITGIKREITKSDHFSRECLAQAHQLATQGYVASKRAWAAMERLISDATPDDPIEEIKDWWFGEAAKWLEGIRFEKSDDYYRICADGYALKDEVEDLLDRGGRVWKMPRRQFLQRLYAGGLRKFAGPKEGRFRAIRIR